MAWLFASLSAFLIGISKGGLKGMGAILVLLMAMAYEGKTSVGIVVPLLILGDILAMVVYRRAIHMLYVRAFLPWILVGVLIGVWIGKDLPDEMIKKVLAVIILTSMIVMWLWDFYLKKDLKDSLSVTVVTGVGAGIFTMIGNLAGAFANIYFLITRLPKKELIGTSTLIFFIVNLFKLPFHIFVWESITLKSFWIDLYLAPMVFLGFLVGWKVVDYVSETWYRKFLYIVTILGAIMAFLDKKINFKN